MTCDVIDLRDFYTTNLGKLVKTQVQAVIDTVWNSKPQGPVVAFGYGVPYMTQYLDDDNVFSFMPSYQGVLAWPAAGLPRSVLVEEDNFPLPDRSVQNILMVHSLENCHNPKRVLAEMNRILTHDGRLLVVVPNRRSPWARADQTPFGHGHPYTMTQLSLLLRNHGFTPTNMVRGLYTLPSHSRLVQATGSLLEKLGPCCLQKFSGIVCIEAMKEVYAGIPVRLKTKMFQVIEEAGQPV